MTLQQYGQIALDRWRWLASGMAIGILAALASVWTTAPTYASSADIYISAPSEAGGLAEAYSGSLLAEQKIRSYPTLLTGDRVRADVEGVLGRSVDPTQISARIEAETLILTATATDSTPEGAQRLADVTAAEFTELVSEIERVPEDTRRAAVIAQIIKPADLAPEPVSPRPASNLALGAVLGLLAGVGFALLRNSLDPTLRSLAEVRAAVPVPVLGMFVTPRKRLRSSGTANQEAFRQIRTQMHHRDPDERVRRIVVTSAVSGEGRTIVARNLAIALGRGGIPQRKPRPAKGRTLLVDADLRAPGVASLLGLSEGPGVTDVLDQKVKLEDAVQQIDPAVDVLPAGAPPVDPGEVFASPAAHAFFAAAGDRYDFVVVVAPALLPVNDAAALAASVDAAILVVGLRESRADQLREAVAILEPGGTPVMGIVVGARPRLSDRRIRGARRPVPRVVEPVAATDRQPHPSAPPGLEPEAPEPPLPSEMVSMNGDRAVGPRN